TRKSTNLLLPVMVLLFAACSKKDKSPGDPEEPETPVIAPPPDFGFKVVGYFPSYRDPAAVPDVKFRMTNVVNYAFATVNASGVPVVNNTGRLTEVVNKAKANNAKVFISVNGSTTNWKNMAATAEGRHNFVVSVMGIIRQYQLD